MTKDELHDFLLDSRKSFRNLYLYIDRVKDIMRYINSILIDHKYTSGHTQFSNIAKDNFSAKLDNWAWDWIPMYLYEFHFGVGKESNISFSIFVVSDTGYYDQKDLDDKLDIDNFKNVDESTSKVIFCIGKNTWFTESDQNNIEKLYIKDEDELNPTSNTTDKFFYAKSYSLDTFLDAERINHNLEDFISRCTEKGYDTIRIKI